MKSLFGKRGGGQGRIMVTDAESSFHQFLTTGKNPTAKGNENYCVGYNEWI